MTRRLGPSAADRLVEGLAPGRTMTIYTTSARTDLADIRAYDPATPGVPGAAISGSKITTVRHSQVPLFWFPDGAGTVYGEVSRGGPVVKLTADALIEDLHNVRLYGAVGDGTHDDTAAIQAAVDSAAVSGGCVYLPAGVYRTTATIVGKSTVRIMGAGREATRIRRAGNFVLMSWYGAATGSRCWYGGLEHVSLDGADYGATILDVVYASQFVLDTVFLYSVPGIALDLVEVWDSKFTNLLVQWSGGSQVADKPAIFVRSGRAASGFGSSTDSTNEISFTNLHVEQFRAGAVKIGPGLGVGGAPNGIYFTNLKLESPLVSNSTAPFWVVDGTRIHIKNVYGYIAALADGAAVPLIRSDSWSDISIRDVFAANAGDATLTSTVTLNSGGDGHTIVDGIYGEYGAAPTDAHILVNGAGGLSVSNLRSTQGALISGWELDGGTRTKLLASDAATSSTSLADIGGLMFGSVQKGTYTLELSGLYESSSTAAGPRFAVGGGATIGDVSGSVRMLTSATAATTTPVTAANTAVGANPGTADTLFAVEMRLSFTVTAAGTVGVRWLESGASAGTLLAGSHAKLTRVG